MAAANGVAADLSFGAVAPPIHLSSTFAFAALGQAGPYDYTRTVNPTRTMLADTLAALEQGAGAVVVSSGMAAIDLVLSQLRRGDLVVAPHDCYGGTHRLLTARREREHFTVAFVDQGDEMALSTALEKGPSLVLVETPSNPLMRVIDIAAIADRGHAAGAKVAVDNTFLSPALQQPLALGADVVVHSTTKYLGGHSDVVGGALITSDDELEQQVRFIQFAAGAVSAPFDAFLTSRGIKTLALRMRQHSASAQQIAESVLDHPALTRVLYPGLPSHPGHALAASQMSGFGGMLTLDFAGGAAAARRFAETTSLFQLAESLGGVESLVNYPSEMTHASVKGTPAEVPESIVRLSVGVEETADLVADVVDALDRL